MAFKLENAGAFVSTSENIDISSITDESLRQILIELIESISENKRTLNLKDTGVYSLREIINGQAFFPNQARSSLTAQVPTERLVYRKVIDIGALPNIATKSVAHGITVTANTSFTRIYGAASDTTGNLYIPLPFVDVIGIVAAGDIELKVNNTNVLVSTVGNGTNFNKCYVILEYIQE